MNLFENVGAIKNPCWICDSWIELEFEWTDKQRVLIEQAEEVPGIF